MISIFMADSTRVLIVLVCRLSPTVPEKTSKFSSSAVVSDTPSSSFFIPKSLKYCTFSLLSSIIQIANAMANLLILGTFIAGLLCFFRISTRVFANLYCLIPVLVNTTFDSWELMNLNTSAASPTITSCCLLSSEIIALSICIRWKGYGGSTLDQNTYTGF